MAYFILLFFSCIRFDIGADYLNHASIFTDKAQLLNYGLGAMTIFDLLKPEPLIYLMIFVTKDFYMSYVYVFAIMSILTLFFMYKAMEYYKIHTIGMMMFIVTFVYFQMWDWSRQGLSLSIFLFSMRYVEQSQFKKYAICILFAVLCHYSSLLLLPFYFIGRFSPNYKYTKNVLACILCVALIAGFAGIFSNLHDRLTSIIPFYGQIYSGSEYTQNGVGTYRTTTYILSMVCYIIVVYFSSLKYIRFTVLLSVGALIYAVAGGNLNFTRMAWPLTSLTLLVVPLTFKDLKVKTYNKMFVRYLYIVLLYVAVFEGVYIRANFRDVVPYETIFSKEFSNQNFRIRAY